MAAQLTPPVNVTVSTDSSTPVDYCLQELARAKAKNRRLTEQNRKLRASRDRWRAEARAWKWGAIRAGPR